MHMCRGTTCDAPFPFLFSFFLLFSPLFLFFLSFGKVTASRKVGIFCKDRLKAKTKKNPKQEGKKEKQQEDTAATSCVAVCFETKISQMPLKL